MALGARDPGLGAAPAQRRVLDPQLGQGAAQEREHGVGVVAGVLVDREQLEGEPELAQVTRDPLDRVADHVLVIPKRKDDGYIIGRSSSHCPTE